jgi:hypothetical protein
MIGTIEEKAVKIHLLCAVALGLAGSATAASAQTSININSSVPAYCSALTPPAGPLSLGVFAEADGRLPDAFPTAATYSVDGYYCNMPSKVTILATPLMNTAPGTYDPAVYSAKIDYSADLVWGGLSGAETSLDGTASELLVPTAHIGTFALTFSAPSTAGDIRPLAGAYSGTVSLTVAFNP